MSHTLDAKYERLPSCSSGQSVIHWPLGVALKGEAGSLSLPGDSSTKLEHFQVCGMTVTSHSVGHGLEIAEGSV